MSNVYSNVKQNYQSAENLMLCATKAYLCCAFMSWAGLDSLNGLTPTKITLVDEKASNEMKTEFIEEVIGKFVEEFAFVEFDIEKAWREQQEQRNSPADQQATASLASLTVNPNLAPGTYGYTTVIKLCTPSMLFNIFQTDSLETLWFIQA